MTDWQDISTAPKDGSWIIATDGDKVMPLAWTPGDPDSPDEYVGWCHGAIEWGGTLYDGFNEAFITPTHWMPLPEPPK
jgi:hypothetical protein